MFVHIFFLSIAQQFSWKQLGWIDLNLNFLSLQILPEILNPKKYFDPPKSFPNSDFLVVYFFRKFKWESSSQKWSDFRVIVRFKLQLWAFAAEEVILAEGKLFCTKARRRSFSKWSLEFTEIKFCCRNKKEIGYQNDQTIAACFKVIFRFFLSLVIFTYLAIILILHGIFWKIRACSARWNHYY